MTCKNKLLNIRSIQFAIIIDEPILYCKIKNSSFNDCFFNDDGLPLLKYGVTKIRKKGQKNCKPILNT